MQCESDNFTHANESNALKQNGREQAQPLNTALYQMHLPPHNGLPTSSLLHQRKTNVSLPQVITFGFLVTKTQLRPYL